MTKRELIMRLAAYDDDTPLYIPFTSSLGPMEAMSEVITVYMSDSTGLLLSSQRLEDMGEKEELNAR